MTHPSADTDQMPNTDHSSEGRPLYIHGLEGDPDGTKGRWVYERFGRLGPKMDAKWDSERSAGAPPSCFEACCETARHALEEEPPPVIIGSSFGGGVTLTLLQRGAWRGPVVLLAPASGLYGIAPTIPEGCHVIIIHDPADDIVPYADSEAIARANPGRVELWPTLGGHKLHSITRDGTLERAIRAALAR